MPNMVWQIKSASNFCLIVTFRLLVYNEFFYRAHFHIKPKIFMTFLLSILQRYKINFLLGNLFYNAIYTTERKRKKEPTKKETIRNRKERWRKREKQRYNNKLKGGKEEKRKELEI